MRSVVSAMRSGTKTSMRRFESRSTRFRAFESNAMRFPSPSTLGRPLLSLPCSPAVLTLMRSVVAVFRSRTNTSSSLLVSLGTSVVATESNATTRPSPLIAGPAKRPLMLSPCVPSVAMLANSLVPAVTRAGVACAAVPSVVMASADVIATMAAKCPLKIILFPLCKAQYTRTDYAPGGGCGFCLF